MQLIAADLRSSGIDGAEREAFWLVESITGMDRAELVASNPTLRRKHIDRARELAARRAAGEPLQYITGVAGFRKLELSVGPGVLIPRPETEVVAGRAIERLPRGGTLVDVGTGSGAIALAVAHERPDARVIATESSQTALDWALRNKQELGLDLELVRCDLLSGLRAELGAAVDVIVSNPPYVSERERASLPVEVVEHEPPEALFAGDDGLGVIHRLISQSRTWLRPGGWIVLEIAADTGAAVAGRLTSGGYSDVSISHDMTGRQRVAEGRHNA